jgi:hypothetical protein
MLIIHQDALGQCNIKHYLERNKVTQVEDYHDKQHSSQHVSSIVLHPKVVIVLQLFIKHTPLLVELLFFPLQGVHLLHVVLVFFDLLHNIYLFSNYALNKKRHPHDSNEKACAHDKT